MQGKFEAGASVRLMRAAETKSAPSAAASNGNASSAPSQARVYSSSEVDHLHELALCVVNYSSSDLLRLAGAQSVDFARILGYETATPELAGRENIVLTHVTTAKETTTEAQSDTAVPTIASVTSPRSNNQRAQSARQPQPAVKAPVAAAPPAVSSATTPQAVAADGSSTGGSQSKRSKRGKRNAASAAVVSPPAH